MIYRIKDFYQVITVKSLDITIQVCINLVRIRIPQQSECLMYFTKCIDKLYTLIWRGGGGLTRLRWEFNQLWTYKDMLCVRRCSHAEPAGRVTGSGVSKYSPKCPKQGSKGFNSKLQRRSTLPIWIINLSMTKCKESVCPTSDLAKMTCGLEPVCPTSDLAKMTCGLEPPWVTRLPHHRASNPLFSRSTYERNKDNLDL